MIAFDVSGDLVSIVGLFYGGQDYESALRGGWFLRYCFCQ